MVQIGALLYSSTFTFREDLKQAIINDPLWNPNKLPSAPVFDIYPADFQGPKKNTKMLFVSAEKSKQNEVATSFTNIYDGRDKTYPNGTMMIFIPLHQDIKYSDDYRQKLINNHVAYIGDEEAISIRGLADLGTQVNLTTGDVVMNRELLKILPAAPGMSLPYLFQLVELNNTGTVTMGIYQTTDREYVRQRAGDIEIELRALLATGEAKKCFVDEVMGITIGGTTKTKHGKILVVTEQSQATRDHIEYINSILHSPKKRSTTPPTPNQNVRQQTSNRLGTRTPCTPFTTVTQLPPTVAPLNNRFLDIEKKFDQQKQQNNIFNERLGNLEATTSRTDSNVMEILNRIERLDNSNLRRKTDNITMQTDDLESPLTNHPSHLSRGDKLSCPP